MNVCMLYCSDSFINNNNIKFCVSYFQQKSAGDVLQWAQHMWSHAAKVTDERKQNIHLVRFFTNYNFYIFAL